MLYLVTWAAEPEPYVWKTKAPELKHCLFSIVSAALAQTMSIWVVGMNSNITFETKNWSFSQNTVALFYFNVAY